jgi:hypothetical protein
VLLLLGVAFVAFVARLDARDWRRDFDVLSAVEHINERMTPDLLVSDASEEALLAVAELARPGLTEASRRVRAQLLKALGREELRVAVAPPDQHVPGSLNGVLGASLARFIVNTHYNDLFMTRLRDEDSVSVFIKRARGVMGVKEARVVTGLKGEVPCMPTGDLGRLAGLMLVPEGILLWFGDRASYKPEKTVLVPADVLTLTDTSLFAVAQQRSPLSIVRMTELEVKYGLIGAKLAEHMDGLLDAFGGMPMGLAKAAAATQALEAYGKVDILGFQFSTRRLPLIAATLLVALSVGLLATTASARRHGAAVAAASTDPLVASVFGRLGVWIAAPALTVWLSLPGWQLSATENVLAIAGAVVATALGAVAVVLARDRR